MEKKIIHIGHAGHGTSKFMQEEIKKSLKSDIDVVVIIDDVQESINEMIERGITINGDQYLERPTPKKKSHSGLNKLTAMASMMYLPHMNGLQDFGVNNYFRKLPKGIDIVKEFELIQQKRSKLTKWERNAVEHIFNRKYKKIE